MAHLPNTVRARMAAQPPAGGHPEPDLLSAFAEGTLTERERQAMFAHLAGCAECREVLALITPAEGPPVVAPKQRSSWLTVPLMRWAYVTAAAALIVGAVALYRENEIRPDGSDARPVPTAAMRTQSSGAKEAVPPASQPQVTTQFAQPAAKQKAAGNAPTQARNGPEWGALESSGAIGKLEKSKPAEIPERKAEPQKQPSLAMAPSAGLPSRTDGLQQYTMQRRAQSSAGPAAAAAAQQAQNAMAQHPAAAPPPPPPPAAAAKPPAAATETVVVTGSAPMVGVGAGASGGIAGKERAEGQPRVYSQPAMAQKSMKKMANVAAVPPVRWTVTADGKVHRVANGASQELLVDSGVKFRAVAAIGRDVWAGGNGGVLFHSGDNGVSWKRMSSPTSDDIVGIEFRNARQGTLRTASGQQFTTSDGGKSWKEVSH